MKIIFRTDSSLEIGSGHVMRCLSLANVLKDRGCEVEFICRQHRGDLINEVRSHGFVVHVLQALINTEFDSALPYASWLGATQDQDAIDCLRVVNEVVDWIIVDHYAIDEKWHYRLKLRCKKLAVIDDLANRKYQCDLLLDQTFSRQHKDYEKLVSSQCELLLGPDYALLRSEFSEWREYSLAFRDQASINQILINMGGVDSGNYTKKILQNLKNYHLPEGSKIVIVMGVTSPNAEKVKKLALSMSCKTEVKVGVENMAEIMSNASIAIGASGSTTWERCCLGLPTIQIVVADNQEKLALSLEKKGAILLLRNIKYIGQAIDSCRDQQTYKNLSKVSSNMVDGLGCNRAADVLCNNEGFLK